jgi:hypothetical protein
MQVEWTDVMHLQAVGAAADSAVRMRQQVLLAHGRPFSRARDPDRVLSLCCVDDVLDDLHGYSGRKKTRKVGFWLRYIIQFHCEDTMDDNVMRAAASSFGTGVMALLIQETKTRLRRAGDKVGRSPAEYIGYRLGTLWSRARRAYQKLLHKRRV